MKWFKKNHPLLFAKYQLHIVVPTTNQKLEAEINAVDPNDRATLRRIMEAYVETRLD